MQYPTESSLLLQDGRGGDPDETYTKIKERKDKSVGGKLGTFDGVFLPTALNVLSILMFLRFGFIIGQMGITGTLFLLVLSYSINLLTTLSVSAISTNGTVKGGGAYYMISRSLGPEFGGAIGIIFYMGQILNASLNAVGLIEPLLVNFGDASGEIYPLLKTGYFWEVLYATVLLAVCTSIALVGSSLVSRTAFWLFVILSLSTLSIPISTLFVKPFYPLPAPNDSLYYTGLAWSTFKENLWPHFTSGAAGSVQPRGQAETFRNLFGIFFPATAGIFAGASMSGDLRSPSKSIPEGTLKGLLVTFILYSLVIISMGSSIPRDLMHKDVTIIQTVNIDGLIILLGEMATSLFSVIMGIVGAGSLLSAIANDKIIPGLSAFKTHKKSPIKREQSVTLAILASWLLCQVFLFADINQIATFITMAFLMTFIVTNLACFLLRVGSAPNFRPSFKYFSSKTAFTGVCSCLVAMFIVDGVSASSVIIFLMALIFIIHYLTPPSKFGDISQLLIYHQVRKYLLRLKVQMSVKYWRPQILLLCDDPRSSWNLIRFCNHLKKGGLYILGHVVLLNDDTESSDSSLQSNNVNFGIKAYREIEKQRKAWLQLREVSKIKAFIQIALGPTLPWGVRNVYLGSGLGGMKPNITVLGFHDFMKHGEDAPEVISFSEKKDLQELPTDTCRKETRVSVNQWVQIVEDLVTMQATVAVAANFNHLSLPEILHEHHFMRSFSKEEEYPKKYIDLYPIQMSSINQMKDGKSFLSTNFDTYTLILQLGSILSTVPEWKISNHILRIVAFVEYHNEIEEEKTRIQDLLGTLRIEAEIKVICLDDGSLNSYNFIVRGYSKTPQNRLIFERINHSLKDDQWWKNLCNARETLKDIEKQRKARRKQSAKFYQISRAGSKTSLSDKPVNIKPLKISSSVAPSDYGENIPISMKNRRYTISNLQKQGLSLSLNMKTQNFGNYFDYDDSLGLSDSSTSESENDDDAEDDGAEVDEHSGSLFAPSALKRNVLNNSLTTDQNANNMSNFAGNNADAADNSLFTSDQASIRSSRSNLRPNFMSYKIPELEGKTGDDDDENDDNDEQTKPSLRFAEAIGPRSGTIEGSSLRPYSKSSMSKKDGSLARTLNSPSRVERSSLVEDDGKGYFDLKTADSKTSFKNNRTPLMSPSIISNDDEIIHHMRTPQFLASESSDDIIPPSPLNIEKKERASAGIQKLENPNKGTRRPVPYSNKPSISSTPNDDTLLTQRQLQHELKNMSFNDLPAKGQHLILNEMMFLHSSKSETDVILSTLPAPSLGTHLNNEDSLEYAKNLAIWLHDLPPVLLVNSQTVTVTTSL